MPDAEQAETAERMVKLMPIQVQCYAGCKADESPRRFLRENRWIEVREIQDRWYQGNRDPEWPIADYFKVTGNDGHEYLLRHDREWDEWEIVTRQEIYSQPLSFQC